MTSKPNGHAPAKVLSQTPGAIRNRRAKERKRNGIVVLRAVLVEPDMVQALVSCGWLHETERRDKEAVQSAIGACLFRSLSTGVTPERPLLAVDVETIQEAWQWAKPGSQLTAENAAKALKNAVTCARIAGFGPEAFTAQMRKMLEERA
jgi:hypothetical protein